MTRPEPSLYILTADAMILNLNIQPRASKNELCGIQENELKIRLTSPPVEGAANKLCREFLAEIFQVSKSAVEIISGEISRHKRVRISSQNPEKLGQILETIVSIKPQV